MPYRKLLMLLAFIFLFMQIWSLSANFSQDNGNLDAYKICTPTGEFVQIRENCLCEKQEFRWNPNVTESTIEFIEKWGRWPQRIALTIYAPVLLTTVILCYFSICCAHDCRYLHSLVPSHGRLAAKFRVWWKVEIFAYLPLLCVTVYPAYATLDVIDAYFRYSTIYIFHHLSCLIVQNGMLKAIEAYHKDDHMEPEASDDTTNQRLTRTISKLRHLIDKLSQNPTHSTTTNKIGLENKPLK
ncbi:hypothetical protein M3Y94_01033900 [Aphelenchoides besseyi]|nr:hypothetical protein M3Y94_01033900 [Aphelenchoides besseyi]KAI6223934.1 hypothetical protein M3Y95_00829400 [Aphelenchoides besseyi]